MKILLSLLAVLLLAGCKPPPMQVGFAMTDSTVCVLLTPDAAVEDLTVNYDGQTLRLCWEPQPFTPKADPRRQ